jgi:hypothetical protein
VGKRSLSVLKNHENLYVLADELGAELGSLYTGSFNDRRNLLEFMEINGWFHVDYTKKGRVTTISKSDAQIIKEPLSFWLSAYHKPIRDKIALLLERFKKTYPNTCRLYRWFVSERDMWDVAPALKLLDFLLCELEKDITEYDEQGIDELARLINNQATRASARLFDDFISMYRKDGKPLSRWNYSFKSRSGIDLINDAYSLEDYVLMAYCVFNEDVWAERGMVEKAVNNRTFADMWSYMAFHFICALRVVDMKRLPAPALPYDRNDVLKNILAGSFSKKEAETLIDDLLIRLKLRTLKPSKTSAHKNVPELKLFVPESLKAPLGIIVAITIAHHPEILPGGSFIAPPDSKSVRNLSNARTFFGEHFMSALSNRFFSSRRSNKSYMQGIELVGNDEPGKPKGHMLAALARSHKTGVGRLSETTEIYLKDARFNGYNPEFIIHQMFERGVFSFIPAVLLEMYAGTDYIRLPVVGQTRLIGELGLNAFQIEELTETVERAIIKCRNAVDYIINIPADTDKSVGSVLQNIASGAAPGRQENLLCLMTAANQPCPFTQRDGCIGCGYEIYTKTAMHTLMREYTRLANIVKEAEPTDAHRYGMILEQAILPAVSEILNSAKILYPNADISGLLDIMEVELDGVNRAERRY